MVTAIVLIKAETDRIPELAQSIAEMDGVQEVFSVAGRHDLVAIVKASRNETLIAFRAYSKKELEAGFELGLD